MLQFYNSLSRKKEKFSPIETGSVKIYTCGPTVYDKAHIGNFRTFLFEDFLKRTLIALGYKVTHIMNITDVDDKTIQRANISGKSLSEITDHFTELFWNDLTILNIIPADHYPRATDHVRGMIKLIKSLITIDYAYVTDDGSVFFKISSFSSYGALTNIDISQMKQSDRVSSDEYGLDNLQDFALWKAYKKEYGDNNVVKVVIGKNNLGGNAIYFSRSLVPFGEGPVFHHIGIYAFKRKKIEEFVNLEVSQLEKRESLEQLRALEAGMSIYVKVIDEVPIGVDTASDLSNVRKYVKNYDV